MAKKEVKKVEETKELVKAEKAEAPAKIGLMDVMAEDSKSGSGFEGMSTNDIAIPFILLLQALSPQLRGTTKISGAEEGDFYNNVTKEVYGKNLSLIPCAFKKSWVEWIPRGQGGGYVQEHATEEILSQCTKDDKNHDILPNGNLIVATAYHYCLLVKDDGRLERAVVSLVSTQLKKSRRWNQVMLSLQLDIGGKKITPPTFSHIYKASSVQETKNDNSWAGWEFGSPKLIENPETYLAAKKFHDDITKGLVKVTPIESDSEGDSPETAAVSDVF